MSYFEELRRDGGKRDDRPDGRRQILDIVPPPRPPAPKPLPVPPRGPAREREDRAPTREPEAARRETPPAEPKPTIEALPIHAWEPDTLRRRRIRRRMIAGGAALLVVLGFTLPTFAFPRFVVTVYPKEHTLPLDPKDIAADTSVALPSPENRLLPTLVVAVTASLEGTGEATGRRFVSERASGTVRIFNAFSSSAQQLVANTRLQDPSGKIFRLRNAVVVPGAKVEGGEIVPTSIAATIVADAPGESYNIAAAEFRIPGFRGTPKYQGFSARSEAPFSGGFEGETRVILDEDLRQTSQALTERLVANVEGELSAKVPPGDDFFSPPGGRQVLVTELKQPRAGDRAEQFQVAARAEGRLFVLRRSHLDAILASELEPRANLEAKPALTQPDLVIAVAPGGLSRERLDLVVSGTFRYYFEQPPDALREVIRASTPRKVEAYLRSRPELEGFRIKRFPRWLWYIPRSNGTITVSIQPLH